MRVIDYLDLADELERLANNIREQLKGIDSSKYPPDGFYSYKLNRLWNELRMRTREQKEYEKNFNENAKYFKYIEEDVYGHIHTCSMRAMTFEEAKLDAKRNSYEVIDLWEVDVNGNKLENNE